MCIFYHRFSPEGVLEYAMARMSKIAAPRSNENFITNFDMGFV